MDHLRQVKVLEVKPVDDSEGKYVRKLSKKAEKFSSYMAVPWILNMTQIELLW